jgi:beta-glucosidase
MEQEAIVLLQNNGSTLPLNSKSGTVAFIGPHADRVQFGDYVFLNASLNGISPLAGAKQYLSSIGSSVTLKYAEGAKLWSNDQSGFAAAVEAATDADAAVVFVGTWTLDQSNLWTPGTNATTGEHNDLSDLSLVGASLDLIKAVQKVAKKTIVVLVSGKPVAEPWIKDRECCATFQKRSSP